MAGGMSADSRGIKQAPRQSAGRSPVAPDAPRSATTVIDSFGSCLGAGFSVNIECRMPTLFQGGAAVETPPDRASACSQTKEKGHLEAFRRPFLYQIGL